jgi:ribonuclease VapC
MVAIAADERRLVSAVTLLEARMVMRGRYGDAGYDALQDLLEAIGADIVPFDDVQAGLAYASFVAYGKGINPASKLNLCDCAAYALAKVSGAPLLFKGDDFRATDIASAV